MFGRGLGNDYDDESDGDLYYSSLTSGSGIESTEDGSRLFQNYLQEHMVLTELARQRKTGEFLDVVIEVEGREFPCHRAMLASTPYFKTMLSSNFAESSSKVVQLHGTDSSSFSKILDFIYTGEIRIGKEDVQDVLQTAHILQFDKILQYCKKFIQDNLSPTNCLGIMRMANLYDLSEMKKSARTMALSKFSDVIEDEEFLSLSVQELSDLLGDEGLRVTSEDDVVNSVIRWLDHAAESSQTAILKILTEIRLPCVRVSVLQKLESHPAVQKHAECLAKIRAAREEHLLCKQAEEEDASRYRRGISDGLAITVGGWKAVREPRLQSSIPIVVQPSSWPLQSIICLDPDNQQYYHITNLPTPVSGYTSVACADGYLYVTGGRENPLVGEGPHPAPSKQAFRYHFPSDTWLRLPDMPVGRAEHLSVVVDGKLFLIGDKIDGDAETTTFVTTIAMDCYDPREAAWIKIPLRPITHTSSKLTVMLTGGKVVFIDVSNSRGFDILCLHAFDMKTYGWRYADIFMGIAGKAVIHSTAAVNDKLYIRTAYKERKPKDSVQYIFDADEGTLNRVDKQDFEDFLRARPEPIYEFSNSTGYCEYHQQLRDWRPLQSHKADASSLCLITQKSRLGWYCRDLSALVLEEEEDREGSD
ncbi:kelch-like protein 24 [Branchiostoma floridae]|uniref:Kelch-like protein 24 n=2 Tax=Branchiostoma floridae TaxID=7739 RepID=A0A9J7L970_BRAFL|nr:kelch-like protein 24 [Branchiostoma floridae]